MKFDLLFPDIPCGKMAAYKISKNEFDKMPESIQKFRINHYLKGDKLLPCWICFDLTFWLEINFEAPICSEECDNIAWEDYFKACKESDKRNGVI